MFQVFVGEENKKSLFPVNRFNASVSVDIEIIASTFMLIAVDTRIMKTRLENAGLPFIFLPYQDVILETLIDCGIPFSSE